MCEPISATTMAYMAIASTTISLYAQHETAKAQAEGIKNQQESERAEALQSAEEQLGVRVREAREKRSRARVAAGESGALGNSFAAAINQSLQDQNMDAALIQKNVAFSHRGIDDRANTSLAGIRSPSALEAGLNIAGSGLSAYNTGLGIEAKRNAAAGGT